MDRANKWSVLLLAALVLAAAACTSNDLDESDADVILEVLGVESPAVTGDTGAGVCTLNNAIACLDSTDCSSQDAGICDFPNALCTVTQWNVTVKAAPLNEGATATPQNDVVVSGVRLSYTNIDGNTNMVSQAAAALTPGTR